MYFNLSLVLNPLSVKILKGLQFRGHLNTHIATLMKSLALQKLAPLIGRITKLVWLSMKIFAFILQR